MARGWQKGQRGGSGGGHGTGRMIDGAGGPREQRSISGLHAAAVAAAHHRRGIAALHCHHFAAGTMRSRRQADECRRHGPKDRNRQKYERTFSAHVHTIRSPSLMSVARVRRDPL